MTQTSLADSLIVESRRLTFADLKNEGAYDFFDVSTERSRTYHCFDGAIIIIDWPIAVAVSKSGHRVWDAYNICYFIPASTWRYLTWTVKDGSPHFVK